MLTLYTRSGCPFCQRVLQVAENLKVEFDNKEIASDETARTELLEKTGKEQVPYLMDSEKGISMHESNDIVEYMRENCAGAVAKEVVPARPRVHVGGSTCESCEG